MSKSNDTSTFFLPFLYETAFLSKRSRCPDCHLPHGILVSSKKSHASSTMRAARDDGPAIPRKISFLTNVPVYESITGYINLLALPLLTTQLAYSDPFVWFTQSRLSQLLQVKLWEYYELPKTLLSGTKRLEHYRHDSSYYTALSYRERLTDGTHICWIHPYFIATYLSYLESYCPHALDTQIMRTFLSAEILKEYRYFCVDTGFPARDLITFMGLSPFFPKKDAQSAVPEYVYLIRQSRSRLYKIGKAQDPAQRLKSLQTSNPTLLHLVHTWAVADSYAVEHSLHEMFAATRQRGEWFALSHEQEADLIVYMAQHTMRET